jgi:hypothetical protein
MYTNEVADSIGDKKEKETGVSLKSEFYSGVGEEARETCREVSRFSY